MREDEPRRRREMPFDSDMEALFDQNMARQERDFARMPTELFHYTKERVLQSVLQRGLVWAGNVRTMNDFREIEHAADIMRPIVEAASAAHSGSQLVDDLREVGLRVLRPAEMNSEVFAFCLSEAHDLLSQWRAYTGDGEGYELAFDTAGLTAALLRSFPSYAALRVEYDEAEQVARVEPIIEEVFRLAAKWGPQLDPGDRDEAKARFAAFLASQLAASIVSFKHPGFHEEREWRIVSMVRNNDSAIRRRADGRSHVEIDLRVDGWLPVTRLTAGPKCAEDSMARTRDLLASTGYDALPFAKSTIPYR